MPCSETARRVSANQQPLILCHVGQRKLICIQKTSGDCAAQSLCVLGVGLMYDGEVASKHCLQRSQDVSTAATGAHKEDMHATPVCFRSTLNRKDTTTHPDCE